MLASPQNLRENPEMTGDPLSDILDLLGARCLLSGGMSASGAWIRHFGRPDAIKIMAVAEGACWLSMDEIGPPHRLAAGDVILVNGRHALALMSDPALREEPADTGSVLVGRDLAHFGGREVVILGGHVAIEANRQDLLLDVLPPLVHISAGMAEAEILRFVLRQLAREITDGRPGAATATAHLAQLAFVQVLRAYVAQPAATCTGWLRGLGDPHVAPALGLLHSDPGRSWTLAELASAAGMSRTSFADRFKTLVGIPPLAYLATWRMQLAARGLREDDRSIAEIAYQVGYTSESAFSNAFKRVNGVVPRRYRLTSRQRPVTAAAAE